MNELIDRIDKVTVESSIYGKQKSQEYLLFLKKIQNATKDSELTSLMKTIEVKYRGKLISQSEMMDLIEKVGQKQSMGGGKVKKSHKKKWK